MGIEKSKTNWMNNGYLYIIEKYEKNDYTGKFEIWRRGFINYFAYCDKLKRLAWYSRENTKKINDDAYYIRDDKGNYTGRIIRVKQFN